MKVKTKEDIRLRLHTRIRKKLAGTPERPRLAVFRSQGHIYAQVINDDVGQTLCAASCCWVNAVPFPRELQRVKSGSRPIVKCLLSDALARRNTWLQSARSEMASRSRRSTGDPAT